MKKYALLAGLGTALVCGGWAQTLTLEQALAALGGGPDLGAVEANLAAARASDAQNQARAGLSVASSLGWSIAEGYNDPAAPFKLGTIAARATPPTSTSIADGLLPQQATGSVSLSTPVTSLNLTGSDTFQTNPNGTLLNTTTVGASLSQTLLAGYFGGATQAAADKSTVGWQTAQLTAQANRAKAVLTLKTDYFTLLSAQDKVDLYVLTLAQRQDAFKFLQAKAATGTATAYDLKVAQAAVRSSELDLAGGRAALDTARQRLINLLGLPAAAPLKVLPATVDAPAATLDEAIQTALTQRIEIQNAALAARSSAIDAALAAGAIVPTVVLTGGVNYTTGNAATTTSTSTSSSVVGTVGVKITPPTVDSGLASNQALQARTLQNLSLAQADQLKRSIPVDVTDAWATWQLNGQRLQLARDLVDNADVNRQILKSQFDSGVKLIADWLNAEVAYSTAQLNVVNALLSWQLSAATLQNLMGR
jgi:outer membrane protein TolC